jgi:hypothetical protein
MAFCDRDFANQITVYIVYITVGHASECSFLTCNGRPCRISAVRRWLPTAAARVRVRAACGVCGRQSGTGAGFLRVLRFPLPIIPPISPLS